MGYPPKAGVTRLPLVDGLHRLCSANDGYCNFQTNAIKGQPGNCAQDHQWQKDDGCDSGRSILAHCNDQSNNRKQHEQANNDHQQSVQHLHHGRRDVAGEAEVKQGGKEAVLVRSRRHVCLLGVRVGSHAVRSTCRLAIWSGVVLARLAVKVLWILLERILRIALGKVAGKVLGLILRVTLCTALGIIRAKRVLWSCH